MNMTDLQAAADRVRRHHAALPSDATYPASPYWMPDAPWGEQWNTERLADDEATLARAFLALHPVATAMLDVLIGIDGKAVLPRNLRVMVQQAVADGRKALNPTE